MFQRDVRGHAVPVKNRALCAEINLSQCPAISQNKSTATNMQRNTVRVFVFLN